MKLKTYSGTPLQVKGKLEVQVEYQDQSVNLPLIVTAGAGPSLLVVSIEIEMCHIQTKALEEVLQKHTKIFQKGLGTLSLQNGLPLEF